MTGNKFLLDTSIIIEVFDGNKKVTDKIHELDEFYISAIVLGELHIGVNRVVNKNKHLKKLNNFLQLCTILAVNNETAMIYGEMVADLYKKGRPLPTNDIWIAASVKQYDIILATKDNHFNDIKGIKVEYWLE